MFGARLATKTPRLAPLRRLIARAMAHELHALVVPGWDVALAAGLDLEAVGLVLAEGPRQANVLLVVGPMSPGIADAASIAYAQMPRPRSVLVLGAVDFEPLPTPDATGSLTQDGLEQAVQDLRQVIAAGAFAADVADFDAPALQSRIEYTCPMHPEIIRDEPGSCPICSMFLVPRETSAAAGKKDGHAHGAKAAIPAAATTHAKMISPIHSAQGDGEALADDVASPGQYTCPMHPEVVSDDPGKCPKCGMTLIPAEQQEHGGHGHKHHKAAPESATQYTCPMHPEVISDDPGKCPKCGMTLIPAEPQEHGAQDPSAHAGHGQSNDPSESTTGWLERIEPGFMSMIEMTDGTPRSSDGLQMEWITTPFGPFFPGLPGGMTLDLTLDGDTVVEAKPGSLVTRADLLQDGPLPAAEYVVKLTAQMRLAPVSYRLLACRAIEAAIGAATDEDTEQRCAAALMRERITSHLFWLAQMGRQLGLARIGRAAATLGLVVRDADQTAIRGQVAAISRLVAQVRGTMFLAGRLATTGQLPDDADWLGPKTSGTALTAAERLAARLTDITQSLGRIDAAPGIALPELYDIADASGHGHASVETPRGAASLHVEIDAGWVVTAELDTPSARHMGLVGAITQQRELADALVAVASLDLSPWEMAP